MLRMRIPLVFVLLAALAAACAGTTPVATPPPSVHTSPGPTSTPQPTQTPTPASTPSSPPASGFYLRAWYEQALPPAATFGQLPTLTISDGLAIDGNIAIPAIYPGPIFVTPFARTITGAGQQMVADEARRLGLVGDETDFTGGGAAPGAQIARLLLIIDGTTYDLSGLADLATTDEPGSPQAFAAFWQELSMLEQWLDGELGASEPYEPERVAVLFTAPVRPEPGLPQRPLTWPLAGSFDQIGYEFPGEAGARCLTVSGDDLDVVLPVLEDANQLSVFHDEVDGQRSAVAVVVVPGAESPCASDTIARGVAFRQYCNAARVAH